MVTTSHDKMKHKNVGGRSHMVMVIVVLCQNICTRNAGNEHQPSCPDESWSLVRHPDRCVKFLHHPNAMNNSQLKKACQHLSVGLYKTDTVTLENQETSDELCQLLKTRRNTRYVVDPWFDTSKWSLENDGTYRRKVNEMCFWVVKGSKGKQCSWVTYDCGDLEKNVICETQALNPCQDVHNLTNLNVGCLKPLVCRYKGPGRSACACGEGYDSITTSGINNIRCVDIDECTTGSADCNQKCVNTAGSFRCECDKLNFIPEEQRTSNISSCVCQEGFQLQSVHQTCIDKENCSTPSSNIKSISPLCEVENICKKLERGGFHCCVAVGTRYCPLEIEAVKLEKHDDNGKDDDKDNDGDNSQWCGTYTYCGLVWKVPVILICSLCVLVGINFLIIKKKPDSDR